MRELGDGTRVVECRNESQLAAMLHDLHQEMQIGPTADSAAFREALIRANVPMSRILAIPDQKMDGVRAQQANVELGDLGESLGVLSLIGYCGHDAQTIHPKNLLKINPRYSERGIDILAIRLSDTEIPEEEGLCDDDDLHIYESKASGASTESFRGLLSEAASTRASITPSRLCGELTVARDRIAECDGHDRRARRLKWFIIEHTEETGRIQSGALLAASQDINTAVESAIQTAVQRPQFTTVILFQGRIEQIRQCAFAYRRISSV